MTLFFPFIVSQHNGEDIYFEKGLIKNICISPGIIRGKMSNI